MNHTIEKRPKKAGVWDIRDFVIKKVGPLVQEYSEWYANYGVSLPDCYAFDPTGWTENLRQMQRAFYLASIENEDYGEFYDAKNATEPGRKEELIIALNNEVSTGFRLFGKHLNDLKDKYGPEQTR